ncbi:SUKH-4 family immunity protein [Nonomuraea purpurea]|uniref:SUKH-4 family immunity protein n=1 Tax=Nonomuraea purpurea TaxID=1849276 RepID=A0ABV8GMG6_9ACTN
MVTHEQLVEAFGEEAVLLMDVEPLRELGLSEADLRILTEVGLPVRADQAFNASVRQEPQAGSVVVFQTGDGDVDVLILGGTYGEGSMRYFLDVGDGVVGLLSLDDPPQAEVVNGSLETFVEFLLKLRLRQQSLSGASAETGRDHTEELWRSLRELDPAAFRNAEAWWAMVMDTLMDRDVIAETRAFLQQRKAETFHTPPPDEPAEEPAHSHRESFERVFDRLRAEGWKIVDSERFAADTASGGLLSPPDDLADHFDRDGRLTKDVSLAWRGGLPSRVQSVFARESLVVSVPEQAEEDDDSLMDMDAEELAKASEAAMEALFAAVHGLNEPSTGVVTCLAAERSSDLCRIVAAFDRLAEQGYVAEPDLWPTSSGGWEHVYDMTKDGEPAKAVFWTTQDHTSSFDARGDLVEDLWLQWSGDREVIADALAGTGLEMKAPANDGTAFLLRPRP